MYTKLFFIVSVIFLFAEGCKKDVTEKTQNDFVNSVNTSFSMIDTSKGWYGLYSVAYEDPDLQPHIFVPASKLIANGVASVPKYQDINGASIDYDMPSNYSITIDSSAFDVTIKNMYNNVELDLYGEKNKGAFSYDIQKDTAFCYIKIGITYKYFQVFPATTFNSFKLLRFAFKQGKAYVFIAGKLVTSLSYTRANSLGKLKTITMGYDYQIECDKVRVYNSYSSKLLMREDFNIDGQSHTIFY